LRRLAAAHLVGWLLCTIACASPRSDHEQVDERHDLRQSREQVVAQHAYEHERRTANQRRLEHIKATRHMRSRLLAANVQCLVRNGTSEVEIEAILQWICSSEGLAHSCHGIQPGGSHFLPNLPKDHLEWAMTNLHENHEGKQNHGHRTCWFGGAAYLLPAPVNELFVELPHDSISGAGRLVRSGFDESLHAKLLRAGEQVVFEAHNQLASDRKRKHVMFEIHTAATATGAVLLAELALDFDGDGRYDRSETFPEFHVPADVNATYKPTGRSKVQGHEKSFRNLENGSVRLRLSNIGSQECEIRHADASSPTHVRIPYFPY